jgi:hypothetical protein
MPGVPWRKWKTQLLIAINLGFLANPEISQITELIARVGRLLQGLLAAINKD